jgi:maleate isomerase
MRPKRVGLVVPPANPAVEPELRALLPQEVDVYAARLPVLPGDLRARVDGYAKTYAAAVRAFGQLELDAILLAATAPSYALGLTGDLALAERLSDTAGCPVEPTSLALVGAARRLGADSIRLISAYPAWLDERARGYWEGAGVRVATVVPTSEAFRNAAHQAGEVAAALERARGLDGDAAVLAGTGLATLEPMRAAAASFDVPLLSANVCGAWRLLARLGLPATPALAAAVPALVRAGTA